MSWRTAWSGAFLTLLFCVAGVAHEYPTRPITLVVPYPPGGGVADFMTARVPILPPRPPRLSTTTGCPSATDSLSATMRAMPSIGFLLRHNMWAPATWAGRWFRGKLIIARWVHPTAQPYWNPLHQSDAVHHGGLRSADGFSGDRTGRVDAGRAVGQSGISAGSVSELIALAKMKPGQIAMGTSAIGTGGYVCAELFEVEAGVDMTIVPYKGTALLMTDLVGGHVPVAFGSCPRRSVILRRASCACLPSPARPASIRCPTFQLQMNPDCQALRLYCITGCLLPQEHPGRSSIG
jgi:Tripartite tricarboxylate transporter family receptor